MGPRYLSRENFFWTLNISNGTKFQSFPILSNYWNNNSFLLFFLKNNNFFLYCIAPSILHEHCLHWHVFSTFSDNFYNLLRTGKEAMSYGDVAEECTKRIFKSKAYWPRYILCLIHTQYDVPKTVVKNKEIVHRSFSSQNNYFIFENVSNLPLHHYLFY